MKMRPFEIGLLVFFGLLLAGAIILLRLYSPDPEPGAVDFGGPVTIWGTLPAAGFESFKREMIKTVPTFKDVNYRYIAPENFDNTFITALADRRSPDLLLLSQESIVRHRSRIDLYPYTAFPERDFRNQYLDGADIFLLPRGIFGFPVAVDPLVMYWNRDLLGSAGFISPPRTWEEVVGEVVPRLTSRDFNRTITRSALAMGEYRNINNAFGIISMLALQGGSAGVALDGVSSYRIRLDESVIPTQSGGTARPFTNAVRFFTNFNATQNTLYSWNRSLPLDRDMFLREDLALYFGYGSEAVGLATRNPNLSFDIAEVPQSAEATVRRTYGRFYVLAVPQQASNKNGAYMVLQQLTQANNARHLALAYHLAPAHRSLVQAGSNDLYGRVYYAVAPTARGWLNPDLARTDEVFIRMLDDIQANRTDTPRAVSDALGRLRGAY